MAQKRIDIEASLLFKTSRAPLYMVDHDGLRRLLNGLGMPVRQIRAQADEYLLVDCDQAQILVGCCNFPFPPDHFKGVTRPRESDAVREPIMRAIAGHGSGLTVIVSERDDPDHKALDHKQTRLACLEMLDYLMIGTSPDLVFWAEEDRILSPTEAELMIAEIELDDEPQFDEDAWEVLEDMAEIDPIIPERPNFFQSDPMLSEAAMQWFEPAEPVIEDAQEIGARAALTTFLDQQSRRDARRLRDSAAGRSSLYVMSATIMIFALPVGATALTYNALSGGSLRATAHMMALTGFGLALMALGMPSPAMALEVLFLPPSKNHSSAFAASTLTSPAATSARAIRSTSAASAPARIAILRACSAICPF